jgi:hypothetical protein
MNVERTNPVFISSTTELSEKLDHFGNWLFISTTVYRTSEYNRYLNFSMWSAYAMASQVVPAMYAISNRKVFVLSEKYLVSNIPEDTANKWSGWQLSLGLSTLLELRIGFKKDEHKLFMKKMLELIDTPHPGDALYSIIKSINYNIDLIDDYHIYIFKQLILRAFEFRIKKLKKLYQYYVCLFLLKNKGLLKLVWKRIPTINKGVRDALPFYLFKREYQ